MTKNCTKKFNAPCYTNVHADRATSLKHDVFVFLSEDSAVIP